MGALATSAAAEIVCFVVVGAEKKVIRVEVEVEVEEGRERKKGGGIIAVVVGGGGGAALFLSLSFSPFMLSRFSSSPQRRRETSISAARGREKERREEEEGEEEERNRKARERERERKKRRRDAGGDASPDLPLATNDMAQPAFPRSPLVPSVSLHKRTPLASCILASCTLAAFSACTRKRAFRFLWREDCMAVRSLFPPKPKQKKGGESEGSWRAPSTRH